ncbi:MAG: peptidyl-prolyl cis-trans isomerase [Crocinitomicaceae bacterium]|nr:peptidyl-prolyl cis-trans isomerase [Crocinitomicaceae bacterium]
MKTLFVSIALVFTSLSFAQKEPIIMTIDGKEVTKSEFLTIYLKNNPTPKYDQASLDEYIELFEKFKLKVAEAEALGYDTIPKLMKELEGYRKQLALPYLIDSAQNQVLVKEAYERSRVEVRASHILIRMDPNALPADTLVAYNRLIGLKARIDKGEDFASVAKMKNGSEDPSVMNNGGDLGYFTAFQMVYPFEDKAFNTNVGEVSNPFRTKYGYHIVKVTDKRAARGTIKVAHLMISTGKEANQEAKENAEKKINEIYQKLLAGEKWDELVGLFSEDPGTAKKGGELPAFGTGTTQRMVPSFEDAAYLLKKDGDFSAPVKTDYGFHIIKRLEWTDVKPFEAIKKEIQAKVNKDERSKKTQDSFVAKLKASYGYTNAGSKPLAWFVANLDSSYFVGAWNYNKLKSNKVIFTLNKKKFTQKNFAEYLRKNYRGIKKEASQRVIEIQVKNWEKAAILDYEESLLSAKYPAYKALVNEYHDGILLYEVMSDKVWNKAVKDTSGLRMYFNKNREKYLWPNRLDATIYECLNNDIASKVYGMLTNDTINSKHVIEVINKNTELNLKVKMNKFDVSQTPSLKDRNLNVGLNNAYEFEGKFYVVKVAANLPVMQKEFQEAKGASTSDYQNYLEQEWLKELRMKHPIVVNKNVLYGLDKK